MHTRAPKLAKFVSVGSSQEETDLRFQRAFSWSSEFCMLSAVACDSKMAGFFSAAGENSCGMHATMKTRFCEKPAKTVHGEAICVKEGCVFANCLQNTPRLGFRSELIETLNNCQSHNESNNEADCPGARLCVVFFEVPALLYKDVPYSPLIGTGNCNLYVTVKETRHVFFRNDLKTVFREESFR